MAVNTMVLEILSTATERARLLIDETICQSHAEYMCKHTPNTILVAVIAHIMSSVFALTNDFISYKVTR